jgi:hypothetical protein
MCRASLIEAPVQVQSVNVTAHRARLRQEYEEAREILKHATVVRERYRIDNSEIDKGLRAVETIYRGYEGVFGDEDV